MVIIEKIKVNRNSADVTVNGEVYKKANLEAVMKFKLKEGEISSEEYMEFYKESDRLNAKKYVFDVLARAPKTEKQCREKLYQKGYLKDSVDYAIDTAKAYGYISDENFAKYYVDTRAQATGNYRLKNELKMKGVSEEIIGETLSVREDETECAITVAKKFMKGKDITDEKTYEKLVRRLAMRGFSYDDIKTAISTIKDDDDN